jgi:hypothetical protein
MEDMTQERNGRGERMHWEAKEQAKGKDKKKFKEKMKREEQEEMKDKKIII